MLQRNIPLDIVSSILDEIPYSKCWIPYLKAQGAETLKACSSVCKSWRPIVQKRLLKKLVLIDPAWAGRYPWVSRSSGLPFKELLKTMRNGSNWVSYVKVFHVRGSWMISDPDFPNILEIFAKTGELRSFLLESRCRSNCEHWHAFPQNFRASVNAILKSQKLTSLRLQGICDEFPFETISCSSLTHLEVTSGRDFPMPFFEDPPPLPIRERYRDRHDFSLDLSQLKELRIKQTLPTITRSILKTSLHSLTHFDWTYVADSAEDREESEADLTDLDRVSFDHLNNLQTISINAHLESPFGWPSYRHLEVIIRMLKQCGVPSSVETINLAIEYDGMDRGSDAHGDDPRPSERLRRDVQRIQLDAKLADLCLRARAEGNLRHFHLYLLIRNWNEIIPSVREELTYERYHELLRHATDGITEAEEPLNEDDSDSEDRNMFFPDQEACSDDEVEWNCRQAGYVSDEGNELNPPGRFLAFRGLPDKLSGIFPSLKSTGMLHFEVADYREYCLRTSGPEIWD